MSQGIENTKGESVAKPGILLAVKLVVAMAIGTIGCAGETVSTPTPTVAPTLTLLATPTPTPTSSPTPTPAPTLTLTPTPTATATPTPVSPSIPTVTPTPAPMPTKTPTPPKTRLVCGQTITEDTILDEDLMCSPDTQFAIVIGASDITLDLGGHVISGYAPTSGIGGIGVFAQGVKGLTISNGTIEGFNDGMFLYETDSVTIENLTIRNQNIIDPNHFITGAQIDSSQNIVVKDILFEFPLEVHKTAVEVYNSDVVVSNIEVHGGTGVAFSYNQVCDLVHAPSNGSVLNSKFSEICGVGIWLACTSIVQITGNDITTVPDNGVGIQADAPFLGAVTGLTVEGNYIHDAVIGIEFRGVTKSTISNNIVSGNSAWGIAVRQSKGCIAPEPGWECFYSTDNQIIDNQTSGNGLDLYHYEACVGNTWERNTYVTKEGSEIP